MIGMAKAGEGRRAACRWLRETKVAELVKEKKKLVEVPYTASLRDTLHALVANNVVAVPVAAPPGRWIGAGGTSIVELDKITGAPRKHYIGIVTMLDVLIHIAEEEGEDVASSPRAAAAKGLEFEQRMSVPVSSVIGHSLEGLSLWTLHPNTSVMDCMEAFSKGVHRAMVPLESHAEQVVAAELEEASPGYRMLTQRDLLNFLSAHRHRLGDLLGASVTDIGALNATIFSVPASAPVIAVIKAMRLASLTSVPVVADPHATASTQAEDVLALRRGAKAVGTLSATDLRGVGVERLEQSLRMPVTDFLESFGEGKRALVTCTRESSLGEVMAAAETARVHRVWTVDDEGLLVGLVSLSDILRAVRRALLDAEAEPELP
ncbi:SNF1-related protein kinase regulatory subunit gamma-like PV42a [Wolffia australiana]